MPQTTVDNYHVSLSGWRLFLCQVKPNALSQRNEQFSRKYNSKLLSIKWKIMGKLDVDWHADIVNTPISRSHSLRGWGWIVAQGGEKHTLSLIKSKQKGGNTGSLMQMDHAGGKALCCGRFNPAQPKAALWKAYPALLKLGSGGPSFQQR